MPGPALPIISPGPAAITACFAKTFSFQMYLGSPRARKEDNPARANAVKQANHFARPMAPDPGALLMLSEAMNDAG